MSCRRGRRRSPSTAITSPTRCSSSSPGTGEYRIGEERLPIRAGDCLGAPAGGEAHQIINTGAEELRYIGFSNNMNAEVVEYPDSGKIGVRARGSGFFFETPAAFDASRRA